MQVESCLACDVHRKTTTVAVGWVEGGEVKVKFLGTVPTQRGALQSAAWGWRERLGERWPGVVVLEAAGMGGVVEDAFGDLVDQVWQVDAGWVAQLRRGAKTDRRDAEFLAQVVLRGLVEPLWRPVEDVVGWRALSRTRRFLVCQRTATANRLRGYARAEGLELRTGSVWGSRNKERLLSWPWRSEGRRLSVEVMLSSAEDLNRHILVLEEALLEVYEKNEDAQLLTTLPRCGKHLALTIALEIGDVRRFGSAAALRSYAGLAPVVHESAGTRHRGGLVRQANMALKWGFTQLANELHGLKAEQEPLAREYYELFWRLREHPYAGVAVRMRMASRLCGIVYAMLRDRRDYSRYWPGPQGCAAA